MRVLRGMVDAAVQSLIWERGGGFDPVTPSVWRLDSVCGRGLIDGGLGAGSLEEVMVRGGGREFDARDWCKVELAVGLRGGSGGVCECRGAAGFGALEFGFA